MQCSHCLTQLSFIKLYYMSVFERDSNPLETSKKLSWLSISMSSWKGIGLSFEPAIIPSQLSFTEYDIASAKEYVGVTQEFVRIQRFGCHTEGAILCHISIAGSWSFTYQHKVIWHVKQAGLCSTTYLVFASSPSIKSGH